MALTNKQRRTLFGLKEARVGEVLGGRPSTRLRLVGRSAGETSPPQPVENRRRDPRFAGAATRWASEAMLRPGTAVQLVDIARTGALIESPTRLTLSSRVTLNLTDGETGEKRLVTGHVRRSAVKSLSPLRYHAAIEFDPDTDEPALLPSRLDRSGDA